MRPSVSGEEGIQPFKFSDCSFKQFQRVMEQVRLDTPTPVWPAGLSARFTAGLGALPAQPAQRARALRQLRQRSD